MAPERPNILLLMFDQMSALSLPCYGHPLVRAPTLRALADRGVVFENAYCNSPLCSPSRYALMTGRLPSRIGAYDNGAELPSSLPTLAHYLRRRGYRTCLSGKMDFSGPDQLHGFEERLTPDLAPSDLGWTPDWEHPEQVLPWYHDLRSVAEAGPADRTKAMDYDERASFEAAAWLRRRAEEPFFLALSLMHPHDPYLAPSAYWERYEGAAIDTPAVPYMEPARRDPHGRRLWSLYDRGEVQVGEAEVRRARRAYYAMIDYADGLIGGVLAALRESGEWERTAVVATSDHGDMLGERGLWFKMTFHERAVRVPLILEAPWLPPRRVPEPVSLVDLLPTLMELAGVDAKPVDALDGTSLLGPRGEAVHGEYMAEGTTEPMFMIRRGRFKYIACEGDPPQLFDLSHDPLELDNLAPDPGHADRLRRFADEAAEKWDAAAIKRDVLKSQRRRRFVHEALVTGRLAPWDYEPRKRGQSPFF